MIAKILNKLFPNNSKSDLRTESSDTKWPPHPQLPAPMQHSSIVGQAYYGVGGGFFKCNGTPTCGCPLHSKLSDEERRELEDLRFERKREIKTAKLNVFKKLPPKLRQQAVDSIIWDRALREMASTPSTITMSPREIALTSKDHTLIFGGATSDMFFNSGERYSWPNFPMPADISQEDLIEAHNEACMEEALNED